jgi:outer membrane protein with beta-barrel domain
MNKIFALAVAAIFSSAINVIAGGPIVPSKEVVTPPPPPSSYFRANELDLGAFATYGTNTHDQSNFSGIGDHAWGGGAEVSYFPLIWAGLRVQGSVINLIPGDNTAGIVRGDFLARYPLDLVWPNVHLAPYGIAGVGGLFSGYNGLRSNGTLRFSNRVLGDFGGGLEYRFTPHIGVFSEATWNVVDGPKNNFLQVNFGARFAF